MQPGAILTTAIAYLLLLFAVAWHADRRRAQGRSYTSSAYVYALSIAVYCTSWTYYGSVGRASESGLGFLPIYLGPTLVFVLGGIVLRKMLRIAKNQRITSIADFLASRYGKSQGLAGLVTVIAVVGIMPYISLQLKAITVSLQVLASSGSGSHPGAPLHALLGDMGLLVAGVLAVFAILFGTRHIDATEHNAGIVVAVAFESVVKLLAFLAVGVFVCYGLFDGVGDVFARAAARPELAHLLRFEPAAANWVALTLLAMTAAICLPRQFQVTIVENVDERHLRTAMWLFPLYLVAINVFVLPIALAGRLSFGAGIDPDTYVLALPLAGQANLLAVIAFVGGLSAASAMVIVETISLSTMLCNDLVMPLLIRARGPSLAGRTDLSPVLRAIRRAAILAVLGLGYLYLMLIGESYALATIGLVSFAAAAQFAPVLIGAIFWHDGTRRGAFAGLSAGFAVWIYTLLIPSFALSDWLPREFVTQGPWAIAALKPHALLGLTGLDPISHSLFWSLIANVGAFVLVSIIDSPSTLERSQATLFVEAFGRSTAVGDDVRHWTGRASVDGLMALARRFVGRERAEEALREHARRRRLELGALRDGDPQLLQMVERLIAGSIGAASARAAIASEIQGEGVGADEVMRLLDETSHVLEYSRQLEHKSRDLERATADLRAANERLEELDRLKDEFLSTVTHELRTPLTSIRSFSEILHDDPDMPLAQRQEFLDIVIAESERLTRLINQVLDLARLEAGRMQWEIGPVQIADVVRVAVASIRGIVDRDAIALDIAGVPERLPAVRGDRDRLIQVLVNLLSNAAKFCARPGGRVRIAAWVDGSAVCVSVTDNGSGIDPRHHEAIFDRFHQVREGATGNPVGSGLGLPICRRIMAHLGGRIWLAGSGPQGSEFRFTVPLAASDRALA